MNCKDNLISFRDALKQSIANIINAENRCTGFTQGTVSFAYDLNPLITELRNILFKVYNDLNTNFNVNEKQINELISILRQNDTNKDRIDYILTHFQSVLDEDIKTLITLNGLIKSSCGFSYNLDSLKTSYELIKNEILADKSQINQM